MSTSVSRIVAQRNHRILLELALRPGNDVCADCKARAPRWASYSLGIFICMNCASIHRKIGTHVTKVKSISMDEWSKEQVEVMKERGNIKSNALYNPNEARHPPPTNMIDSERDSELEKFIRSKYEFKRFVDRKYRSAVQQPSVDPRTISARSRSTPLTDSTQTERKTSLGPPLPPKTPENLPAGLRHSATIPLLPHDARPPARSVSQPLPPLTNTEKLSGVAPLRQPAATQSSVQKHAGQIWEELISLQGPSQSSSLPLQYSPVTPVPPFTSQPQLSVQQQSAALGVAPNPFMNLSLGHPHSSTPLVASPVVLVSTPTAQYPFASSAPPSSPALHLGTANPFNQAFSSPLPNANGTLGPGSNPFSPPAMPVSMSMSAPTTSGMQSVIPLPTESLLQTRPLGVSSQISTIRTPSFPSSPFSSSTAGLVQDPFAQGSVPGHAATNPFSAMQMGPVGLSGEAALNQQPQSHLAQSLGSTHGFGAWAGAGQGVPGTF